MPSSSVPQLTKKDFKDCGSLQTHHSGVTVVFFYIPESRFCQEFAPEISNFSDNYSSKSNSKAYAVNMSNSQNTPLIQMSKNFSYSLGQVWPTIMVYYKGNPCSSYTGPRTAEMLSNFINTISSDRSCDINFNNCL